MMMNIKVDGTYDENDDIKYQVCRVKDYSTRTDSFLLFETNKKEKQYYSKIKTIYGVTYEIGKKTNNLEIDNIYGFQCDKYLYVKFYQTNFNFYKRYRIFNHLLAAKFFMASIQNHLYSKREGLYWFDHVPIYPFVILLDHKFEDLNISIEIGLSKSDIDNIIYNTSGYVNYVINIFLGNRYGDVKRINTKNIVSFERLEQDITW